MVIPVLPRLALFRLSVKKELLTVLSGGSERVQKDGGDEEPSFAQKWQNSNHRRYGILK